MVLPLQGRGDVVLSKCANPSCSHKFRYLYQGRLFFLKAERNHNDISSRVNFAGHVKNVEYAWLCDKCSLQFEVVLDSEERLKLRARYLLAGSCASVAMAIGFKLTSALGLATCLCEYVA